MSAGDAGLGDLRGHPPPGTAKDFAGKTVLVVGLGRFGGGVETARFLQQAGAQCVITDQASRLDLAAPAEAAEALGARLMFGPQTAALLQGIDLVIVSPAIPTHHPLIVAAVRQGLPVTTEMNIVLTRCKAPIYGVTGTKGKSTTVTLLARMLEAAGRTVHLGGNIGRPLIGSLHQIQATDRVVLEMSSFQLWWTAQAGRAPDVSLVTNLFADHLDRHGTLAAYAAAKRLILDGQPAEAVAVLPKADPQLAAVGFETAGAARRVFFGPGGDTWLDGETVQCPAGRIDLGRMALLGDHNRQNALAAATAALADPSVGGSEITARQIEAGVLATKPLPHRMEPVRDHAGIHYVDDSNATNPMSTLCALAAFERPVVLLLGGKDKGVDASALVGAVARRAKAVIGIGTTGPTLVAALAGRLPTRVAQDLESAVRHAGELAEAGDVVLLSPAYSSLDQFPSFAVRGDTFQSLVRLL